MRTALVVAIAVWAGCWGSKKDSGEIVIPKQDPAPASPTPDQPVQTAAPENAEPATPYSNDDLESTAKSTGAQRDIAWEHNEEGIAAMKQGKFSHATAKFRDAVARVPEPAYFLNLCMSLHQEGKFSEALVACDAVEKNNPTQTTKGKAEQMTARIKVEAKKQGIRQ